MVVPDIRNEYRYGNYALVSALFVLALVPLAANLYVASRSNAISLSFPTCAVLQHTGKPCAGCGLTRSVLALYKGDFALSRSLHPAGTLLLMLVFLQLALRVLYLARDSAWLPWLDMGQLILTGLLFRFALTVR